MKIYSVSTGNIDPLKRASRKAVKFISKLDGLYGVHPAYPHGTLVFFRSLNDAKMGRNRMEGTGIQCGMNICEFEIEADGVPRCIGPAER